MALCGDERTKGTKVPDLHLIFVLEKPAGVKLPEVFSDRLVIIPLLAHK